MTVSELREYAEKGFYKYEVAGIAGLAKSTITNMTGQFGIEFNPKAPWQRRIEKEFEMPLNDLLNLFVRDHYSLSLTAETLGVFRSVLRRYCKKEGIKFPHRSELREECKPKNRKRGLVRNPWGCKGRPKH